MPVQRYDGRDLGQRPHIAVLGSCKVGNFVATLPMLRLLRRRYPEAVVDFWGSEVTRDFETALCGSGQPLSWRCSWDLTSNEPPLQRMAEAAAERRNSAGPLDLVINCDGFNPLTQTLASWLQPAWVAGGTLSGNGRRALPWGELPQQRFLADPDWDSPEFVERYAGIFESNYIAELLCHLAFLEPSPADLSEIKLPWTKPAFEVPEILIHCTTTRAAKIWPFRHWAEVLRWCEVEGYSVGLVGAPPARQAAEYHAGEGEETLLGDFPTTLTDLRGRTSLIELAGACRQAKAVLSVDAGPLHIAVGVGAPTLAIVGNDVDGIGASPIRLWLPRGNTVTRTVSSARCDRCSINHFRNDGCIAEQHLCMEAVSASAVIRQLTNLL
jgi:heptosyltransferase-3